MSKAAKPEIPMHPLIVTLTQDSVTPGGPQPESAVKLSGYVGPSSQAGVVRLYSNLDDLSFYLEFDQDAVLQTAETPERLLPDKALSIWVKASTPVRWVQQYQTASALGASILSSMGVVTGSGSSRSR